jgi:hypothetical protein
MLKLVLRIAMFIAGVALVLDIGLPTTAESLQVDQHTSHEGGTQQGGVNGRWADTSYTLHLIGGRASSCGVGHSAYTRLKDGDKVDVVTTRLFKNCIRISQGDEPIESDTHWKLFALIGGCLLIAAAIGWLQTDDEGAVRLF